MQSSRVSRQKDWAPWGVYLCRSPYCRDVFMRTCRTNINDGGRLQGA